MIKRILGYTLATMTLAVLAAGPARATDGPAFNVLFFSDGTYTEQVGWARAECDPDPHARMQVGHSTDYQQVVYVGDCIDGVLYYY